MLSTTLESLDLLLIKIKNMTYFIMGVVACIITFIIGVYYAQRQFEDWAEKKATVKLEEWKFKEEKRIREDAYQRSRAVSFGKTIEHYVPFMKEFPVEPKDVQFFGKPIDYIAFSNRGNKKKCAVHFIEVKSGDSNLNSHQYNIKQAIINGRIHWHEFNVDGIWEHESKTQHLNNDTD